MRRFIFAALFLVIIISGGCHSGNRLLRRSLTKKLYTFFTKTLQDNYHSNSEDELYRRFLYDYLHNDVKLDNLDEKKLNIICDELFKRDMDHYYYFYAEFINYKTDKKFKDKTCQFFNGKYPGIPVAIDCELNKNKLSAKDSPYVYLNIQEGSYLSTVDTEKHTSIKEVCECENNFKELNLYEISTYFLKGEGSQQLDRKDVKGFLAVVFWKVLCSKAHIDFYNLYDPQKISYINELEKEN